MKALLIEPINQAIVDNYTDIACMNHWQFCTLSSSNDFNGNHKNIFWDCQISPALIEMLRKQQFKTVIPGSEFFVNSAEQISRALFPRRKMQYTTPDYRNKYSMRLALSEHNVLQPTIYAKQSLSTLTKKMMVNYPCIFKPVNMASSLCVKLCNNELVLKEAIADFATMLQCSDKKYNFSDVFLCEEYIKGDEYSTECIIEKGHCVFYQTTKKFSSKPPYFDEIGHVVNFRFSEKMLSRLETTIDKIIRAWCLYNTVIHVEYKIVGDDIVIIEIGNRIPGDRISDLIRFNSGVNLEENFWLVKANMKANINHRRSNCMTGIVFIYEYNQNYISHLTSNDELKIIKTVRLKAKPVINTNKTHIYNRLGYMMFHSSDINICKKIIEEGSCHEK